MTTGFAARTEQESTTLLPVFFYSSFYVSFQSFAYFSSMFITLVRDSTSGIKSTSLQSNALREAIPPNNEPFDLKFPIIVYHNSICHILAVLL